MQTLGLSDSTPRSEGRLKSLLWPSIQNGADVDYLGTQGYWVCTVVAVISLVLCILTGQRIIGAVVLLYFYLGGVGVRERSRYAATVVLVFYLLDTLVSGVGLVRVLIGAILVSNFRATWLASGWKPESEDASLPPRLNDTLGDKFADQLPSWLWPKVRILYYIFSACLLALSVVGATTAILERAR
jgi:hypothetical protein